MPHGHDEYDCDSKIAEAVRSGRGDGVTDSSTDKDYFTSLFDYIRADFSRGYVPSENDAAYADKRERVYTFIKVPRECEKFMFYGFLQCLDTFLFLFTFLPVRLIIMMFHLVTKPHRMCSYVKRIPVSQRCDVMKIIIIMASCILIHQVDVSRIYHVIRGQAIIKLYIFYNMIEVADRLFSSFGQDILDALMVTVAYPRWKDYALLLIHLAAAILYVFLHAMLILLQATTLNVAFNSHNKALLTIMMSNNFVELKGSVFKKFEKLNLFQMSCSDVRERFHVDVLLLIVCLRNMTDVNWDMDHLFDLIPDVVFLLLSEVVVDAVKHAFITKFNNIPASVYKEYSVMLAEDALNAQQKNALSDIGDQVSRRMGFTPIPLACLLIRIVCQSVTISSITAAINVLLGFLCLMVAKVSVNIIVVGMAVDYKNQSLKEQAENAPDKEQEQANPKKAPAGTKRYHLSEIDRFTMCSSTVP